MQVKRKGYNMKRKGYNMKGLKVYHLLVLVVMALCLVSTQANAQLTYYFGYDSMFNPPLAGGTAPTGTWATATFTDVGGDVSLTLAVDSNLPGGQFIGEFFFNYSGDASLLHITDNGGDVNTTEIGQQNDFYQADGDGFYDIWFDFAPAGNNKLMAGESINYTISGVSFSDFNFLSYNPGPGGNPGPFYAAAKLQGIPCGDVSDPDCQEGTTSAWSAGVVPEPVSSTLFLVGAATLGYRRFRKNKNKTIA